MWSAVRDFLYALHTDERGISPLLAGAIGLLGGSLFGGGGGGGGQQNVPFLQEQKDILGLQKKRIEQANPLYEAAIRLAMQLMPRMSRENLPTL